MSRRGSSSPPSRPTVWSRGSKRPDQPFCLGVQWHPENFVASGDFKALFRGLVDAARAVLVQAVRRPELQLGHRTSMLPELKLGPTYDRESSQHSPKRAPRIPRHLQIPAPADRLSVTRALDIHRTLPVADAACAHPTSPAHRAPDEPRDRGLPPAPSLATPPDSARSLRRRPLAAGHERELAGHEPTVCARPSPRSCRSSAGRPIRRCRRN